jgi:GrpB-like predicted nucleotidyltransferase (UPF0157 family)
MSQNMIDPNEKINHVELTEPNPEWPRLFTDAASEIKLILQNNCIEIYHIGSTAIANIYAKPIIDLLPVVKDISLVDALNSQFEALGYVCMGEYGITGRRFYWKSKTNRTHNVHLFEQGSPEILRHLAFKDFLIAHENYAQSYSLLKRCLAEVFPQDIESYVNGKGSFVQMIDYKTGTARAAQLTAKDNIIIQPYHPAWPKLAAAEIKTIKGIVGQLSYISIDHVGSTAVPTLASKPIIDIFITVNSMQDAKHLVTPLESLGYLFWEENPDTAHLRFFKGMPPFGEKRTHHVHIVEASSNTLEHRILFRDILRRDEKIRQEYEILKLKLSESHLTDREVYTDKKGEFIEAVLRAHGYSKPIAR